MDEQRAQPAAAILLWGGLCYVKQLCYTECSLKNDKVHLYIGHGLQLKI